MDHTPTFRAQEILRHILVSYGGELREFLHKANLERIRDVSTILRNVSELLRGLRGAPKEKIETQLKALETELKMLKRELRRSSPKRNLLDAEVKAANLKKLLLEAQVLQAQLNKLSAEEQKRVRVFDQREASEYIAQVGEVLLIRKAKAEAGAKDLRARERQDGQSNGFVSDTRRVVIILVLFSQTVMLWHYGSPRTALTPTSIAVETALVCLALWFALGVYKTHKQSRLGSEEWASS